MFGTKLIARELIDRVLGLLADYRAEHGAGADGQRCHVPTNAALGCAGTVNVRLPLRLPADSAVLQHVDGLDRAAPRGKRRAVELEDMRRVARAERRVARDPDVVAEIREVAPSTSKLTRHCGESGFDISVSQS